MASPVASRYNRMDRNCTISIADIDLEATAVHEEFVDNLPQQQSYLEFVFMSLGVRYTLLLPLAALVSFVLVLVLVLRGKGPWLSAAIVLLVPLPLYVGILGLVDGLMSSFQVVAMSESNPRPSDLAQGVGMSLVSVLVGINLSIPGYLLAVIGTIIRSLAGDPAFAPQQPALAATIVEPNAKAVP